TVSTLASAFPILALFVFPVTPSTDIYTLSLHDALPILYPGQKVMQTEVVLERAESLPGRKVSVISIADDMQIRLAEVCLQPPLRSEEHTSELQSRFDLVCRLLLEKKQRIRSHTRMLNRA